MVICVKPKRNTFVCFIIFKTLKKKRLVPLFFESFDKNYGWDGTIQSNGKRATNDVYVYIFEAQDETGIPILKRGFVSLIE